MPKTRTQPLAPDVTSSGAPRTEAAAGEGPYLFVYGSLRRAAPAAALPREARAARASLEAHADWAGEGVLQGRLYRVDWYPAAVSSRSRNEHVAGDLWRVTDWPALRTALDAYEDARPERSRTLAGAEYVRARRTVRLADGAARRAWVYLYNQPVEGFARIDSGDYAAFLRDADARRGAGRATRPPARETT
ncbi:hypothetical protein GC169_08340 [bacterium]|nr:hypothetical protein [bacterium]